MLLHQDASSHVWLADCGLLDLVVTMDDATGAIYSAIPVEQEGTRSSFAGLIERIVNRRAILPLDWSGPLGPDRGELNN